jgi:hypothetical protein
MFGEQGAQQTPFTAEVVVKRGLLDARRSGNFLNPNSIVAARSEHFQGAREQVFAVVHSQESVPLGTLKVKRVLNLAN